ncbi:MAG: hypothetical protein P8P36_09690 [Akkermansiaceae bacterium]|nr:hypothetical protein [Akkermansiaceae bacterium]
MFIITKTWLSGCLPALASSAVAGAQVFKPEDQVLVAAGSHFESPLKLMAASQQGTPKAPFC